MGPTLRDSDLGGLGGMQDPAFLHAPQMIPTYRCWRTPGTLRVPSWRTVQNIMACPLIKIVKDSSFKMQLFCYIFVGRHI